MNTVADLRAGAVWEGGEISNGVARERALVKIQPFCDMWAARAAKLDIGGASGRDGSDFRHCGWIWRLKRHHRG
jgi:hypothetical protein